MFKFRLGTVLSLKENIEESKKRELGKALQYKLTLEEERQQLFNKHQEGSEKMKEASSAKIDIQSVKNFSQYTEHIMQQLKTKAVQIDEADRVVEQRQEEFIMAMRQRKILDNLKSRHYEEFKEEEKQKEQLILDEVVGYQYVEKEGD